MHAVNNLINRFFSRGVNMCLGGIYFCASHVGIKHKKTCTSLQRVLMLLKPYNVATVERILSLFYLCLNFFLFFLNNQRQFIQLPFRIRSNEVNPLKQYIMQRRPFCSSTGFSELWGKWACVWSWHIYHNAIGTCLKRDGKRWLWVLENMPAHIGQECYSLVNCTPM